MQRYFWVLISVFLLSCEQNQQAVRELNIYFDLDSLLDKQVLVLSQAQLPVTKSVMMDGKTESSTSILDSVGWASEFVIVRDFDLNKPYNVGAYREIQSDQTISYELADKTLDAPVQYFQVKRAGESLEITSEYFEDKSIYQHRRKLQLMLEEGILSSYEIKGFQKMIMKDTIYYRIAGEVKAK